MDDTSITSISEQEEQEAKEPDVTSSDPIERKLARRIRIQRRLEAIRRQNMGSEGEVKEEVPTERRLLDKQIIISTQLLQRLEKEGDELVTNIRVANDSREVDRREAEGISREKIIGHLAQEAEAAEIMFQNVNIKWQTILEYHDPLHIHESMEEQQQRGNELLKQKDCIIEMLKAELKNAEKKFTMDQTTQDDDIKILTSRIEKQVTLIREAYRQELQLIEDVIGQERQILKDMCDKKWEEMSKQRTQVEEENLEKKIHMLEEFAEDMRRKRLDFQETFRENKISLETDIQALQKELEVMKSTTLMNTERMDYNYQILKKREDENIIINSQQKRKINKLRDIINALKKKIQDYDTYSKNEIVRVTNVIAKLRNQISMAEKKSIHFTEIHDKKFMQIWNLNTQRATKILDKILTTDKILCEQQLGISYQKPAKAVLRMEDLESFSKSETETIRLNSRGQTSNKHFGKSLASSKEDVDENVDDSMYQQLVRHVLENISEKANFLTEKRLKQVLKPYSEEEGILVRLDNVFFALDVKNSEAIDMLLEYFLPYTHCLICNENESLQLSDYETPTGSRASYSSGSGRQARDQTRPPESDLNTQTVDTAGVNGALIGVHQPEHIINEALLSTVDAEITTDNFPPIEESHLMGEASGVPPAAKMGIEPQEVYVKPEVKSQIYTCKMSHPLVISSVYVLRAMREFVTKVSEDIKRRQTLSAKLETEHEVKSRTITPADIIFYWERFRQIFTDDRERLWEGLLAGLKKYLVILKDRKKIHDEIVNLKRKNEELKTMLRNYETAEDRHRLPGPCPQKKFFKYVPKKNKRKLPPLC